MEFEFSVFVRDPNDVIEIALNHLLDERYSSAILVLQEYIHSVECKDIAKRAIESYKEYLKISK